MSDRQVLTLWFFFAAATVIGGRLWCDDICAMLNVGFLSLVFNAHLIFWIIAGAFVCCDRNKSVLNRHFRPAIFTLLFCSEIFFLYLLSLYHPLGNTGIVQMTVSLMIMALFFKNFCGLLNRFYFLAVSVIYVLPLLLGWFVSELVRAKTGATPDLSWLNTISPLYLNAHAEPDWIMLSVYLVAGIVLFIINNTRNCECEEENRRLVYFSKII